MTVAARDLALPILLNARVDALGLESPWPVPYVPGPLTCPGCRCACSGRFGPRRVLCAYHGLTFTPAGQAVWA